VKSAKSIGIRSSGWPPSGRPTRSRTRRTARPPKGFATAPYIAAARRCPAAVAALTYGRCSGAFTPEATVAARHANAAGAVGVVPAISDRASWRVSLLAIS
jgi:hypothetical protein